MYSAAFRSLPVVSSPALCYPLCPPRASPVVSVRPFTLCSNSDSIPHSLVQQFAPLILFPRVAGKVYSSGRSGPLQVPQPAHLAPRCRVVTPARLPDCSGRPAPASGRRAPGPSPRLIRPASSWSEGASLLRALRPSSGSAPFAVMMRGPRLSPSRAGSGRMILLAPVAPDRVLLMQDVSSRHGARLSCDRSGRHLGHAPRNYRVKGK